MPLLQSADAGTEYLIPWAKNKLHQYHEEMLRSGVALINRTIFVSDGAQIFIKSIRLGAKLFRDTIRITGGGGSITSAADPFFPLWGIQSALMPGVKAETYYPDFGAVLGPALNWAHTVQHVSAYYPSGDAEGNYTRQHWLVICRYCKRVAEYTWEETGFPATSDAVGLDVSGGTLDVTYATTYQDTPVDPGTPLDGITLDGTQFYFNGIMYTEAEFNVDYLGGGFDVTFIPDGLTFFNVDGFDLQSGVVEYTQQPEFLTVPADPMTPVDGISLDGTLWYATSVAVGKSASDLADDLFPGWDTAVYNLSGAPYFIGDPGISFNQATGGYDSHHVNGESVTLRDYAADGTYTTRVVSISPSLLQLSKDNEWGWFEAASDVYPGPIPAGNSPDYGKRWLQCLYKDARYVTGAIPDPATQVDTYPAGYSAVSYDPATGYVTSGSGTRGSPTTSLSAPFSPFTAAPPAYSHQDQRDYSYANGGTDPWYLSDGYNNDSADPANTLYLADVAAYNAYMANDYANYATCALNLVASIERMMNEKKATVADVTELCPDPTSTDHHTLAAAWVVPAMSSGQLTVHLPASGAYPETTLTHQFNSLVDYDPVTPPATPLVPTTIYGATVGVSSPPVPDVPDTPWAVTVANLVRVKYDPRTKAFSLPQNVALKYAAFSKSATTPMVLGQTHTSGYIGFYETTGEAAVPVEATAFLEVAPNSLMTALCVGTVSLGYITYYSWRKKSPLAMAYRTIEHIQTSGAYSFTQPPVV